jgi:hypothetical protein
VPTKQRLRVALPAVAVQLIKSIEDQETIDVDTTAVIGTGRENPIARRVEQVAPVPAHREVIAAPS